MLCWVDVWLGYAMKYYILKAIYYILKTIYTVFFPRKQPIQKINKSHKNKKKRKRRKSKLHNNSEIISKFAEANEVLSETNDVLKVENEEQDKTRVPRIHCLNYHFSDMTL